MVILGRALAMVLGVGFMGMTYGVGGQAELLGRLFDRHCGVRLESVIQTFSESRFTAYSIDLSAWGSTCSPVLLGWF